MMSKARRVPVGEQAAASAPPPPAASGQQAPGAQLAAAAPASAAFVGKQAVKVVIRVRPSLPHEADTEACISTTGNQVAIVNPRNITERLAYTFDRVFGEADSQESVFAEVQPVVLRALAGNNATIFAYGQTGSGKTHTINGTASDSPGIIPRTVKCLLSHVGENALTASIAVSYLEIYNEKIFDLLAGEPKSLPNLDLRETASKSIVVSGLSNVVITSLGEFEKLHDNVLENGKTLSSKLHIIDLAGSEDNKRTGNVGARMVESGAINKSLFVLGQVVEALNKGHPRIPYRDSKITRFLQDSLGGGALGLMIACCAPGQQHYWDTYNTLNFATKSSFVKNVVVKHEIAGSSAPHGFGAAAFAHPFDLDEIVRQQVEAQLNERVASIRREMMRTETGAEVSALKSGAKRVPLSTEWRESMLREADEAIVDGRTKDAITFLKRALVLERADTPLSEHAELVARIAALERSDADVALAQLKKQTEADIISVINSGDLKAIMRLKQIGKKRAEALVAALAVHGEYATLADLARAGLSMTLISNILQSNLKL
nr:Kinesin-like protein kif22 [Polyrhizophydium stewartii]